MPSTTTLVDLLCDELGLDATVDSDDRTAALSAMNRANRDLCQRVHRVHKTATHTPDAADTDIDLTQVDTLSDEFAGLDHIRVVSSSGSTSAPISRSTRDWILTNRSTTQGSPAAYAYAWPYVMLDRPSDGTYDLKFNYIGMPNTLIEGNEDDDGEADDGSEYIPSAVPPGWHERLLVTLSKVFLLEGREGREQDASYHRSLFQEALVDFRSAQSREGGLNLPADSGATRIYDTPTNLRTR